VNPRSRYDEIADDLVAQNDNVTLGQMMGMPAIKCAGKMIGGFSNDEGAMVFKLSEEAARERALALDGAHLFDPSGGRRAPMKEWVVVPAAHAGEWANLASEALTPPAG
jgi:TfoX/Sxy family transcriptional regulator of competence genes